GERRRQESECVTLVESEELVVIQAGPRNEARGNLKVVNVHAVGGWLLHQCFRALVVAGEAGPFVHHSRPCQLDPELADRKQGEVSVAHSGGEKDLRGGLENGKFGNRRWRIQRIKKQIVVKDVLIPPETGIEAIHFSLLRAYAADIVRIAAVTEVGKQKIVKQHAGVRRRMHLQRVFQKTGTCSQVDHAVPRAGVAGEIGDTSAEFS